MANVTINGASFTDVPAIVVPQTGGGIVQFTDVSTTTAVESDVASGKKFFKADGSAGTGTASGGGGGAWYGINPVLLDSWTLNIKLSDTSYPTWTPSTTRTVIYAAEAGDPIKTTPAPDGWAVGKQYIAIMWYCFSIAYTTGEMKPRIRKVGGLRISYTSPNSSATNWAYGKDLLNDLQPNILNYTSAEFCQYVNKSGAETALAGASATGIFMTTSSNPLMQVATSGGYHTVKLFRPAINAQANASYMSTTSFGDVNAANTTLKAEGKLYQVDDDFFTASYKECANILMNGL